MARERPQRELTALVTGVGAPPGVSIFKALRQSSLRPRIVATDADPFSVGLFRADAAHVLPHVERHEAAYLERLSELCLRERVKLVCFGSEAELRCGARHRRRIEEQTGARLVVNDATLIELFTDKWATACALRSKGLPAPDTALAQDSAGVRSFLERHSFPLVLKPRRGSGSRNLHIVRDAAELDVLARYVPEPVLQEYLLPDDEEYTVGIYQSPRTGYVGQIAFRRDLAAGLTYKAEVVFDQEIERVCRAVVETFDLWGPVNVQLRKTAAGVRIFEINPRFSSSSVMRAYFGFNEAELCLRDLVLGEAIAPPRVRPGWSLRYWNEIYLAPGEYERGRTGSGPLAAGRLGSMVDDF
jgi:carbamoyl-phosphate synthase large subunit